MGMTYLHELAEELHNLQEKTRDTVENEKIRGMAQVVLETVRTMQDFDDRVRALEGQAATK